MTKLLEQAIAKVRELSELEQNALAALILSVAGGSDASGLPLDRGTEAAIREGLAQAERGDFVSDAAVAEANKRHGL
jgi:ribosomal protein S6E (S10)